MEREILFRGLTKQGEWVEGDLIQYGKYKSIRTHSADESGLPVYPERIIRPETVGQFTGLCDKNGTKIFEGDKVKYFNPYSKKWFEHIVLFDNQWSCFGLFEQGNQWCKESDWVKIKELEVIGNIHQK